MKIYEKFQAQKELSNELKDVLAFVKEMAKYVAKASSSADALPDVNWTTLQERLNEVEALTSTILNRGKFFAWWKATEDQQALKDIMVQVREDMKDTNFQMNIDIAINVDKRANELRAQLNNVEDVMAEGFEGLKKDIGAFLNMDDAALTKEVNEVLANQQQMLTNQSVIQGNQMVTHGNQEKILAKTLKQEIEFETLLKHP